MHLSMVSSHIAQHNPIGAAACARCGKSLFGHKTPEDAKQSHEEMFVLIPHLQAKGFSWPIDEVHNNIARSAHVDLSRKTFLRPGCLHNYQKVEIM